MIEGETSIAGPARSFPSTAWGLIAQIRDPSPEARRSGLEDLCRRYWKPVYVHLRLTGAKSNEDAKDLTQAFFLWVLSGDALARYAPERAGFRTYLKLLLHRFVQHHEEALRRLKRGGGVRWLPLQEGDLPLADLLPDPQSKDPEKGFDAAWMATLIRNSVERVRERLASAGRADQFRVFEAYDLVPETERPTYGALAERLCLRETDVRNHLHGVREEIRSEIRSELAATTTGPEEFEEEWSAFLRG